MATSIPNAPYDYIIIGSGFGGSVSAMRLTEKGYRVLVLERGKRFNDQDFPKSNWAFWKYLWNPALRSFGILQISTLSGMLIMHGAGVGGGSLGYANVLMEPDDHMFSAPDWKDLADWKTILRPHYDTAKRMLGVARNPLLWPADRVLEDIAAEMGKSGTFEHTNVGVFFGPDGEQERAYPDPYFGGQGPDRISCNHCGGCMVGCRYNSKNTLVKNYLYFAEKWGARVQAETEVRDIRPLPAGQPDGARYEVIFRSSTAILNKPERSVRARNVIVSAGTMGTLKLLYRCRDHTASLPDISPRLGELVRTNTEEFGGAISRKAGIDYSKGVSISALFHPDKVTTIEPVRYPSGSGLIRFLAAPLVGNTSRPLVRFVKFLAYVLRHPIDYINATFFPKWADRTTILLIMQKEDTRMHVHYRRSLWTIFRRGLVSEPDPEHPIPAKIDIGHQVTRTFAEKIDGIPAGSIA
ncbi:MAG: GMC family oxidoreductase N-terminal domain-containing protein, partial [Anaerolineae bacterium]|nr:GMC family oxidoreductase N-terminal domain-containing protein [Anaerolineae bacterium]